MRCVVGPDEAKTWYETRLRIQLKHMNQACACRSAFYITSAGFYFLHQILDAFSSRPPDEMPWSALATVSTTNCTESVTISALNEWAIPG